MLGRKEFHDIKRQRIVIDLSDKD